LWHSARRIRGPARYIERVEKQTKALAAGYAAAAAALVLFGGLGRDVLLDHTIRFDAIVRGDLHALASPRLTDFFWAISCLGSELVLVPLAAVVIWRHVATGRKHAAWLFLVAVAGAELLDRILKLAFHRPRPEPFFGYPLPSSYSFPSGHSLVAACFYGVAAAMWTARMESRPKAAAIWAAAAALVLANGLSRIYLGVHYPSDVAAGYAAAVIWVAAVRAGYRAWLRRRTA